MAYQPASDRYAVAIDHRAVLLDVAADRYRLLGPPAATGLRALERGNLDHPAIPGLKRLGLSATSGTGSVHELQAVVRSAVEIPGTAPAELAFHTVGSALLRSMMDLKVRGLRSALRAAQARVVPDRGDQDRLIALAQAYVRQRSHLPLRNICLPDSLALHRILCGIGLASHLVFGVRLDPFMAHCWVQSGDMVLNDTCDHLSAYRPILHL